MSQPINWNGVDVHLDEGQRQMVLLALAKLAIERPGFMYALEEIARLMDNMDADNRPELFHQFHKLHSEGAPAPAPGGKFPEVWCSQCGRSFGPGNHGFSHCKDHIEAGKR